MIPLVEFKDKPEWKGMILHFGSDTRGDYAVVAWERTGDIGCYSLSRLKFTGMRAPVTLSL